MAAQSLAGDLETTESHSPHLRWLNKWLPRSWRLDLLEALAWPEFEVKRYWLVPSDDGAPGRIEMLSMNETRQREQALWAINWSEYAGYHSGAPSS